MMCNKQLSTGEELYIIDENKFVCKEDYLNNTAVKDTNLLSGNRACWRVPRSRYARVGPTCACARRINCDGCDVFRPAAAPSFP